MQGDLFTDEQAPPGDDFVARARAVIMRDLAGRELLFEAVRMHCQRLGIEPHHHNAWGALSLELEKDGLIRMTSKVANSKDPRSHGRRQPIWLITGGTNARPTRRKPGAAS